MSDMNEWVPDLGEGPSDAPVEAVGDVWDPTWPYNFKWGISAQGQVSVWRTKGGKDGRPGHRAELRAEWGRDPMVGQGDILGLATYIPAEVKFDGTVVAPSEIRVQTYYSAMMPQELVRWFNQHFPDAFVREAAVIQNQLPLQRQAALWALAETDWMLPDEPEQEEEEIYKWVWNEKEGVLLIGAQEGNFWLTHAQAIEESWGRELQGDDALGYAVRVNVPGAEQVEMETYGDCPTTGVQAVRTELAKMFPDDQIIMPAQYDQEKSLAPPSTNLDYHASAKWAHQNLSGVPVKAPVSDSNGFLSKAGGSISTSFRRGLKRLLLAAKGADLEGVMVCLYVPDEIAQQLAQEDGEKPEDMHITLAYFVDKFEERKDWADMEMIVSQLAEKHPPFEGSMNGFGMFFNEDGDVLWAAPNIKGINEFQQELVEAVEEGGFPVSKEYEFTPHITLKYEFDGEYGSLSEIGQLDIVFKKIAVSQGLERKEFDLTGEGFLKETGWLN